MIIPLRPLIGFGAGFAAMATVLVAGFTAPAEKTTTHTAARCPDSMTPPMHETLSDGAERPV